MARLAAALVAAVVGFVLLPLVGPVAPAGAATEEFTLSLEHGELLLRGAEEAFELDASTTVSGTNTDGVLSNVQFDTPTISFVQEVTDPVPTSAAIDAMFAQVSPGTGAIDPDGNINVRISLRVDLDINVALFPAIVYRCTVNPVVLDLASVAPHDGEQVTLRASNFAIPAAPYNDNCPELIGGAVNGQLVGGGHSLTLRLAGGLTFPPEPGEPTITTLAASPAGGAGLGEPVTLTAEVALEDEELEGVPHGLVEFRDGDRVLGIGELDDTGVATLEVNDLSAGNRRLTARFLGAPPDFGASVSAEVLYNIIAGLSVVADVPATVRAGGLGADFDLTVINPGFGVDLDNIRVDVRIQRDFTLPSISVPGSGPIGPDGGTPRIELLRIVGDAEQPIPLTWFSSAVGLPFPHLVGAIGDPAGWSLSAGASSTEELRLRVAAGVSPGPLRVTFTVVQVDPGTEETEAVLASGGARSTIVEAQRRVSQVQALRVVPVAARQGTFVTVANLAVTPAVDLVGPYGEIEVLIDGRSVPILSNGLWAERAQTNGRGNSTGPIANLDVYLPPDTPVGPRTLTVSYLGDPVFAPSQTSWPIRVEAALGTSYTCAGGIITQGFYVLIEATAGLSSVVGGATEVPLRDLRIDMRVPRAHSAHVTRDIFGQLSLPPSFVDVSVAFAIGPDGEAVDGDVTQQAIGQMISEDGQGVDNIVRFTDSVGQALVDGEVGEVVDVTIDEVVITFDGLGFASQYRCLPANEPASIGQVTVAGTTLVVDTDGPVREGEPIVLSATRLPAAAGAIEFAAGDNTVVGHVVAPHGQAEWVIADLPAGTHQLTARFLGDSLTDPVTVSEPVEVVVLPGPQCPASAQAGNAAVVRLVYLELLGRCPDEAGFSYWTGQLNAGTSPEAFARAIARTSEAMGVVVNDGYQTMLGRDADAAGRTFWVNRMLAGSGRYDQLLAELAGTGEFWTLAGGTEEGFVTRVYERLLGRAPEQAGLDYWVGRLEGGTSPGVLVRTLANLDEPLGVLVGQSYQQILARAPEVGERSDGITFLRATGDRPGLYAELIGRPEFTERAQGFPNPT